MANLIFNRLLVLSNSEKSGNQFQFSPKKNIITAKDNNVGKSTLVELLFWAFGCELQFDRKWSNNDVEVLLDASVGSRKFRIHRHKDAITVREADYPKIVFDKIGGRYSVWFAELVGFKALLQSRDKKLVIPPPAYFFIPFYIDQKKSWTKAWDGFERLEQFADWRKTIIKYHVGLLSPEYFELEREKYEKKDEREKISVEIEKLEVALKVVDDYLPEIAEAITVNSEHFEKMTDEIRKDLTSLSVRQESILNDLARLKGDEAYLSHQQAISMAIIREIDKDYIFSVENIEADTIECPICGTQHDNSIYSKAAILVDKNQAENQYEKISSDLEHVRKKIDKVQIAHSEIKESIESINRKYIFENDTNKIGFAQIIEDIAGKSIKLKVNESLANKIVMEKDLKKDLNDLVNSQKGLMSTIDVAGINSSFNALFSKFIDSVGADEINTSEISSPLDYNKVSKEGGAAENVRAMLAYYLTVYKLIESYGQKTKAPFVIDTPNQHEQSNTNYERIIRLLVENFPNNSQLFLCAMDNDQIDIIRTNANVITLDENRILQREYFTSVKFEIEKFQNEQDDYLLA
jgi:hypothetical protein